jgi:hypothetical protein
MDNEEVITIKGMNLIPVLKVGKIHTCEGGPHFVNLHKEEAENEAKRFERLLNNDVTDISNANFNINALQEKK